MSSCRLGRGWEHVCINVTAENQWRADERVPILLSLPAKHKGIMLAPLLSAVDLTLYLESGQIENVLADGENYDGARPCRYEWVKSLSDQCRMFRVPFTFCGTGNIFIKDDRVYHVCKAYQDIMALRSGLSYPQPSIFPMFRDSAPGAAADSNAADAHTAASAVKDRCMKTSEEKSVW